MPKRRSQFFQSKLSGGQGVIDRAKLRRKEVRDAYKEIQHARYWHSARLNQASHGHAVNIMETRRKVKEAEKRYRDLTGEDCP